MNILELYQGHGLTAKTKTAGEQCGPCPQCGGDDRFTLFMDQGKDGMGRYWCRQCGASGDRIQFLRDFKGMTYHEACRELGIEAEGRTSRSGPRRESTRKEAKSEPWTPKSNAEPGPKWQAGARKLIPYATAQLAQNAEVLQWLQAERGLTMKTIRAAKLGWNPKDQYRHRAAWGLPEELREGGQPKKLWFPAGLVIPIFSLSGKVNRVKFRRPEGKPKYIPLPTAPKNTAPMVLDTGAKVWAVVESELDAILLAQEAQGLLNVIALGSASYPPDATAYPVLEAAPYVLLCLDYDEAGQKKTFQWWAEHFPQARPWPVPEGKDVCEAWAMGWPLLEWIKGGIPPALLPRPITPQPKTEAPPEEVPPPAGPWEELQTLLAQHRDEGLRLVSAKEEGKEHGFYLKYPEGWTGARCLYAQNLFLQSVDDIAKIASTLPQVQQSPPPTAQAPTRTRTRRRITPYLVKRYKQGREWILAHLDQLKSLGWTRRTLFKVSRFRHPLGEWGLAWVGPWNSEDLREVRIDPEGAVVFTLSRNGRQVKQSVRRFN